MVLEKVLPRKQQPVLLHDNTSEAHLGLEVRSSPNGIKALRTGALPHELTYPNLLYAKHNTATPIIGIFPIPVKIYAYSVTN
jgi:hypothetical protein